MIGIFIILSPELGVEKMKMPHGVGKKKKKKERKEKKEVYGGGGGLSAYEQHHELCAHHCDVNEQHAAWHCLAFFFLWQKCIRQVAKMKSTCRPNQEMKCTCPGNIH
jgi:hypothetical protein